MFYEYIVAVHPGKMNRYISSSKTNSEHLKLKSGLNSFNLRYFYTLLEACDGGDLFDFFRMLMADDMTIDTLEREVRQVLRSLRLRRTRKGKHENMINVRV